MKKKGGKQRKRKERDGERGERRGGTSELVKTLLLRRMRSIWCLEAQQQRGSAQLTKTDDKADENLFFFILVGRQINENKPKR